MDDMDFDLDTEIGGGVTLVFGDDDDEIGCDDLRPAMLRSELMNLDAETQINFNAVWTDR